MIDANYLYDGDGVEICDYDDFDALDQAQEDALWSSAQACLDGDDVRNDKLDAFKALIEAAHVTMSNEEEILGLYVVSQRENAKESEGFKDRFI